MGFFDHHEDAYNQVQNGGDEHKSSWSHELIAGAASFEAAKAYENHVKKNGQPANHQLAKELFAGFVGAEVDKLVETKGLDQIDKFEAKRHAENQFTEQTYNYYQ